MSLIRFGTSGSFELAVTRNGESVTFDYDVRNWPTDDNLQTGIPELL